MQIRKNLFHGRGSVTLWAAACVLLPGALLAQSYSPEEEELTDYLSDRTVLVRMSCKPEVEADPIIDIGLIPVKPRVSWGTGVFIRKDGYVVTTEHTLSELLVEREEWTSSGARYTTACDPDQVKIGFFRASDLAGAANNGEPPLPEDAISTRDRSRAIADVLFLKANTFGDDRLPFICAHELYQNDAVFEDLPILVRQIEIQEGGAFRLRTRDGLSSSERGGGPASNFLLMDIPTQPGASGAAVVDESGRIVGLVHGYSEMVNPGGNDDYLIPYRLFDEIFRDYSEECAEGVVPSRPLQEAKFVIIDNKEYDRGHANSVVIRDILLDNLEMPIDVDLERSSSQWSSINLISSDADMIILHWSAFEGGTEQCNPSHSLNQNSCNAYFIRVLNELGERLPDAKFIIYSRTRDFCAYADAFSRVISRESDLLNGRLILFDVWAAGRGGSFQNRETKLDLTKVVSHLLEGRSIPNVETIGEMVPGAMEGVCIVS